jgi:hypothetical protein
MPKPHYPEDDEPSSLRALWITSVLLLVFWLIIGILSNELMLWWLP